LNDDALGPRFIAMSDAYDETLQNYVLDAANKLGLSKVVRPNGTYCFLSGPTYETPTEGRFLRLLGVDSVGMSTVPEIIIARHCGMKILGLSLITNKVICDKKEKALPHATHEEVLEAVEESGKHVEAIIKEIAKAEILGAYLAALPAFKYDASKNAGHHAPAAVAAPAGGCCGAKKAAAAATAGCGAKRGCDCGDDCKCGTDCKCPPKAATACASKDCNCGANCNCGTNCNCATCPSTTVAKKSCCLSHCSATPVLIGLAGVILGLSLARVWSCKK
jgi:hypothetical protein